MDNIFYLCEQLISLQIQKSKGNKKHHHEYQLTENDYKEIEKQIQQSKDRSVLGHLYDQQNVVLVILVTIASIVIYYIDTQQNNYSVSQSHAINPLYQQNLLITLEPQQQLFDVNTNINQTHLDFLVCSNIYETEYYQTTYQFTYQEKNNTEIYFTILENQQFQNMSMKIINNTDKYLESDRICLTRLSDDYQICNYIFNSSKQDLSQILQCDKQSCHFSISVSSKILTRLNLTIQLQGKQLGYQGNDCKEYIPHQQQQRTEVFVKNNEKQSVVTLYPNLYVSKSSKQYLLLMQYYSYLWGFFVFLILLAWYYISKFTYEQNLRMQLQQQIINKMKLKEHIEQIKSGKKSTSEQSK